MFFIIVTLCIVTTIETFAEKSFSKIDFWQSPKKGANIFNQIVTRDTIKAAKNYGIEFIRLAPDKFLSQERDFLIGDCDHYKNIVPEDLTTLLYALDICFEENMPVVLTLLSLPGCRWQQHNNNQPDLKIWFNDNFQEQAVLFWQDLARALQEHPAIVGYNILNEPNPERIYRQMPLNVPAVSRQELHTIVFNVYAKIIAGIRTVDTNTPIILDSTQYADPKTFDFFIPHNDTALLYSFHMYEPYAYTNAGENQGRFTYPGTIEDEYWDKTTLQNYLQSVIQFQEKYTISSSNIVAGEFGGHRTTPGLENYFNDLLEIFEENKWHFAFYAFREDTWDGMDYELGTIKIVYDPLSNKPIVSDSQRNLHNIPFSLLHVYGFPKHLLCASFA